MIRFEEAACRYSRHPTSDSSTWTSLEYNGLLLLGNIYTALKVKHVSWQAS